MMLTNKGIILSLWGAVVILLLCDFAVAKENLTPDQSTITEADEESDGPLGAVTENVQPASFKEGQTDSIQLGKPVDSGAKGIGNKAAPAGHKLILVADSTDKSISRLTTADDNSFQWNRYDIGNSTHRFIAVDYDKTEDFIYWTSVNGINSLVGRTPYETGPGLRLDGQQASVPDGMAVDVISRNLYWTDTGIDRIIVSRLDGSFRKSLITEDLDEPRAIVVDPNDGWMYWTDWGNPSKIERARMDGTQRSVIVNVAQGHWPNGIALDSAANRLYWCNGGTGEIWTSGGTGSNPSPSRLLTHSGAHLFDIAVDETYLYWTAWNKPGVHRISKTSLQGFVTLNLPHFKRLNGIHVSTSSNTPSQPNACSIANGNCAQLCLPVPGGGKTCACQDGWSLGSDGKSCQADACQSNPCQNGACDGVTRRTSLTCNNDRCVSTFTYSYVCNCPDGFSGVNCETNDDDCDPNTCQNGGQCVDGVNSYTCNCPDGFLGQNCEIRATTVPPTGTSIVCGATWFLHEGKCYCLLEDLLTYREATDSCADLDVNGQLAVVKRPSTPQVLLDYVERVGAGSAPWIGIDDENTEGVWRYEDGSRFATPGVRGHFHFLPRE